MSLLDSISGMVTPSMLGGLGRKFGIPENKLKSSMGGITGMFMHGLAGHADDHTSMNRLSQLVNESPDEHEDVSGLLDAPDSSPMKRRGNALLDLASGGSPSSMTGGIGKLLGLGGGAATGLLGTVSALAMTAFRKLGRTKDLNASSLGSMLRSERDTYRDAIPAPMRSDLLGHVPEVSRTGYAHEAHNVVAAHKASRPWWALMLIPIALLAIWAATRGRTKHPTTGYQEPVEAVRPTTPSVQGREAPTYQRTRPVDQYHAQGSAEAPTETQPQGGQLQAQNQYGQPTPGSADQQAQGSAALGEQQAGSAQAESQTGSAQAESQTGSAQTLGEQAQGSAQAQAEQGSAEAQGSAQAMNEQQGSAEAQGSAQAQNELQGSAEAQGSAQAQAETQGSAQAQGEQQAQNEQQGQTGENAPTQAAAGTAEAKLLAEARSPGGNAREIPLDKVTFPKGSSTPAASSDQQLDNVAQTLQQYPDTSITITGLTDSSGSKATNQALSKARAEKVRDALVDKGIDQSRITAEAGGVSQKTGPDQSRRTVSVKITSQAG
jgi:outer membrane protein OmpA-like peptidoglycan-associated protein